MAHHSSALNTRTFHLFPRLPSELRENVWEYFISAPRLLKIHTDSTYLGLLFGDESDDPTPLVSEQVIFVQPPNPLLLVCRESREYALKNSDFIELRKEVCIRRDPPPQEIFPGMSAGTTDWRIDVVPEIIDAMVSINMDFQSRSRNTDRPEPRQRIPTRLAMKNVILSGELTDIKMALDALGADFAKKIHTIALTPPCWEGIKREREELARDSNSNSHLNPKYRDAHTFLALTELREIIFMTNMDRRWVSQLDVSAVFGEGPYETQLLDDSYCWTAHGLNAPNTRELLRESVEMAVEKHPEWKLPRWWLANDGKWVTPSLDETQLGREFRPLVLRHGCYTFDVCSRYW